MIWRIFVSSSLKGSRRISKRIEAFAKRPLLQNFGFKLKYNKVSYNRIPEATGEYYGK